MKLPSLPQIALCTLYPANDAAQSTDDADMTVTADTAGDGGEPDAGGLGGEYVAPTPVGTVDTCGACKAGSECKSDPRCIPMEFDGQVLEDGFCLKTVSSGCDQPYSLSIKRASLSSAPEDSYCGISEALTTCTAIRDLEQSVECGSDDNCGDDSLQYGRCELVGTLANRCTYSCATNDNCPVGEDCASGTTDTKYCGGL